MMRVVIALVALVFFSCAPRFTVYLHREDKMNTDGIVVLSIDTLEGVHKGKRVVYVIRRDLGSIGSAVYGARQRKIQPEVDSLSR